MPRTADREGPGLGPRRQTKEAHASNPEETYPCNASDDHDNEASTLVHGRHIAPLTTCHGSCQNIRSIVACSVARPLDL